MGLLMDNITIPPYWQWMAAFAIMAITDVCWALYTKTASTGRPVKAAGWAVALFLLGGLAVVGYTTNPVLLAPSALGAFFGTYFGVKMSGGKGA